MENKAFSRTFIAMTLQNFGFEDWKLALKLDIFNSSNNFGKVSTSKE